MIILPFRITATRLRISESVHLFSMSVFMAKTFRHWQVLSAMVCFLCCYLYSTLRDSRAALKNQNVVVPVNDVRKCSSLLRWCVHHLCSQIPSTKWQWLQLDDSSLANYSVIFISVYVVHACSVLSSVACHNVRDTRQIVDYGKALSWKVMLVYLRLQEQVHSYALTVSHCATRRPVRLPLNARIFCP